MEWDFLKIEVKLTAYSFEAVLMVSLLVAYQGNSIKRRKE